MTQATVYTVHLRLTIEHMRGPEPDWQDVAEAAVLEVASATLEVGDARLLVDEVDIDTAGAA